MLLNELKNLNSPVYALLEMNKMICEAEKKQHTKLGDEVNLDDIFNTPKFNAPSKTQKSRNVTKQQAGKERTQQAVSGVRMDPQSNELLGQIDQSELEDDRPMRARATVGRGEPRLKPPGTDLVIRGRDIANRNTEVSTEGAEPNWHKIEDLPGYMKSAIRAIGRRVFAPLTSTDIEDIDVIANLNDSGPNSEEELQLVGRYLKRNGTRQTEAEMDFNQSVLQGYKANIQVWTAGDLEFLTVKDHAGHYIYSWPIEDSKNFNLFKNIKKGVGTERNRVT